MSEIKVKNKKLDLLPGFAENSLDTNEQLNMPELEIEESAEQKRIQQGQGLKISTTQQMIRRLSISLAQLKGGNYSQKLKNEIRQLFYSLYRSKKLSKII